MMKPLFHQMGPVPRERLNYSITNTLYDYIISWVEYKSNLKHDYTGKNGIGDLTLTRVYLKKGRFWMLIRGILTWNKYKMNENEEWSVKEGITILHTDRQQLNELQYLINAFFY